MKRKTCLTLLAALSLVVLGAALSLADLAQAAEPPPAQPDVWISPGTMPQAMAAYTVQCPEAPDDIYTVGGIGAGNTTLGTVYRYNAADDAWTTLASLPEPRRGEALACYQGKIYAAGGVYQSVVRNTLYIYDIASNTWSSGANLPDIVGGAGLGAWEGKLYLAGGSRIPNPWTPVDRVDVYDIATDTWAAGAGTAMPTASSYFGAVQRGPFLFAVGGLSGDINVNIDQTQRYNMIDNTWEIGPTFTSRRGVVALATTATHLYALGGTQEGGGALDTAEVLDLSAWPGGAWTDLGDPLPQPNVYPASACTEAKVGGEVWIIGGGLNISTFYDDTYYRPSEPCFHLYSGDLLEEELSASALPGEMVSYTLHLLNAGIYTDTYDISASGLWTVTVPITVGPVMAGETVQFDVNVDVPPGAAPMDWDTAVITVTSQGDPATEDTATLTTLANGWFDAGPLAEPRAGVVVQCPDESDAFYRLGGMLTGPVDTNQLSRYDVATATWTNLANMPQVRRNVAAACYQGKIYAAGGYTSSVIYNTLFIYDIASNTWSSGANLPSAVQGVALGAWEGKLYLLGGTYVTSPWTPTGRVDVYDIATNTWTAGGGTPMPTPASFPGWVQRGPYLYVVGGYSGNFASNCNTTQRYDMAMNTWQVGPAFTSQRGIVSLGMTGTHLYALGGDANGGDGYDATDLVEVLDLSAWPSGAWTDLGDPLPQANIYPTSACTEAMAGGEVWSIGGVDGSMTIYNTLYFHPAEPCVHYGLAPMPPSAGAGLVGQTLDYLLTITNTSVVTDYYSLAFSSTWTVDPLPAAPVMVGPGQSAQVAFGVEIPADALDGESVLTEVTATSLSNYMESHSTTFTSVAQGYAMAWNPGPPAQTALPGQVVTYTLTITNVGHLADTYMLTATGHAWEVTLPAAPVVLDVGESAEVQVRVMVPLTAWPGDADAVTIMVTSQGNALVSQQAVLTSSAGGYRVSIPLVLRD